MADIWTVYHGQPGYEVLSAMPLGDLARWHARAIADHEASKPR